MRSMHTVHVAFEILLSVLVVGLTASCGDSETDPCARRQAVSVTVVHEDATALMDLGALPGRPDGTLCLVGLVDVVEAADLGVDVASSYFDFEAVDGFRPSAKDCAPLDGATLAHGEIDVGTGTLVWDPALGLPGCYSVREARTIFVLDELPNQ